MIKEDNGRELSRRAEPDNAKNSEQETNLQKGQAHQNRARTTRASVTW